MPLYSTELLAAVQREIAETTGPFLPSIAELARKLRVRAQTVSAALRELRSRGVVDFRQGTRVRITAHSLQEEKAFKVARETSRKAVAQTLVDWITEGRIRGGQHFPKVAFVSSELGVSGHTVLAGLRLLEQRALAHKQGRVWVAGPAPQAPGARAFVRSNTPFIAIIQPLSRHWDGLHAERTEAFYHTFTGEAERTGVRLIPITVGPVVKVESSIHADLGSIVKTVRGIQGHYLGALVAAGIQEIHLQSWCAELLRLDKPALWFDSTDQGAKGITAHMTRAQRRLFVRCRFDETAAVRTCVQFLYERGHRILGFPAPSVLEQDWVKHRLRLVLDACREVGHDVRCIVSDPPVYRSRLDSLDGLTRKLHGLLTEGNLVIRQSMAALVELAEELDPDSHDRATALAAIARHIHTGSKRPHWTDVLLQVVHVTRPMVQCLNEGATALVAANDWVAERMMMWLRHAGIDVPNEVSVISFDNSRRSHNSSVTSIDFGFGPLAYFAFHAIRNDIPFRRDKDGGIACRPYVAIRETVELARSKPIRVAHEGLYW